MKNTLLSVSVLAAALASAGCGDTSGVREELGDVAHEAGEVGEAVSDWFALSRDEFDDELAEQRAALKAAMAELEVEAERAASEGKAEVDQAMASLKQSWSKLEQRSAEWQDAAGDTWQDVREDLVEAMEDVKHSLAQARDRLADDESA